jgi:predicted GNAT family N-acyltransferase
MGDVTFEWVPFQSPDYWEAVKLRNVILRLPLGLELKPEELVNEGSDFHAVGKQNGIIVASLTLTPQPKSVNNGKTIRTRQVAVQTHLQGQGVGRKLMGFVEALAKQKGFDTMTLHARLTAVDFYKKLGYTITSDLFHEVSIPHYIMEKKL